MSLSLLSALLGGYLIGYFSILMNYYITFNWHIQSNRSQTMDTSFSLIGTNLALSCAIVIFSILGFLFSFCGIRAGRAKGLHLEETDAPYAEKPGPKGRLIFANLIDMINLNLFI